MTARSSSPSFAREFPAHPELDALVEAPVAGQRAGIVVGQQVYEAGTGTVQPQHRRLGDGLDAIRGRGGGQQSRRSGGLPVGRLTEPRQRQGQIRWTESSGAGWGPARSESLSTASASCSAARSCSARSRELMLRTGRTNL